MCRLNVACGELLSLPQMSRSQRGLKASCLKIVVLIHTWEKTIYSFVYHVYVPPKGKPEELSHDPVNLRARSASGFAAELMWCQAYGLQRAGSGAFWIVTAVERAIMRK